ncbi:porin family protein [bacterium]|nr:porin family protein [bacterium]
MKTRLLLLLAIIFSINCYSQISFEKGYYIDNSNQKVDCLIKNMDRKNNPTDFVYKLTEDSDKIKANIKTVKEFGIYNVSKYERHAVKIDRSSNDISEMSNVRKPVFIEEELFLKVLMQGEACLYEYADGNLQRFFYSKDGYKVEQLVFKEYLNADKDIAKNNTYKQQLWTDLKCATFKISKVENLVYRRNKLINFFVEYNECNNQEFTNFGQKQKRNLFNLSIRPGINRSSLSIKNSAQPDYSVDFDNEIGFRFGIEAEIIMRFNRNKWALLIEPTYQYYKSKKKLTSRVNLAKADYKSIELPIGVRHYFFLNEDSKLFINGLLILDYSYNSIIDYFPGEDFEIGTRFNFAYGLGYKYNDRYSLELRYQTGREILDNYLPLRSDYKTLSVIFGYSLFKHTTHKK